MNAQPGGQGSPPNTGTGAGLEARIEEAKRRLQAAASTASEAERRLEAEIHALEADLERVRAEADHELKAQQLAHEEELQRERETKERAIAAAEERLGEIEAQAEAAEERVAAAEERAARSEREVDDDRVRARESAAAWLRGQLDALRREG
jgi:chromosome segregation ATPase